MNFAVIDVDQKFHRHIIGKSGGNGKHDMGDMNQGL